jgi:hypothetical protein
LSWLRSKEYELGGTGFAALFYMKHFIWLFTTATLLLLGTSSFAAETSSSAWGDKDLTVLQAKIKHLEASPDDFLENAMSAWKTKCQRRPKNLDDLKVNCYLLESDVLPQGRKDQILIFRGEGQTYDQPLVSSSVRQAMKNAILCPAPCNNAKLSTVLNSQISKLSFEQGDLKKPFAFEEESQSWHFIPEDSSDEVVSNKPVTGSKHISPVRLLKAKHSAGADLFYVDANKTLSLYDPYVSFSASPYVAIHFTEKSEGDSNPRIFVASVPLKNIDRSSKCSNFQKEKDLVPLSTCLPQDALHFGAELEFDAIFFLPSDYLLKVYSAQRF